MIRGIKHLVLVCISYCDVSIIQVILEFNKLSVIVIITNPIIIIKQ